MGKLIFLCFLWKILCFQLKKSGSVLRFLTFVVLGLLLLHVHKMYIYYMYTKCTCKYEIIFLMVFKCLFNFFIQWILCNPTPEFSDILWHPTKNVGPKVFLVTRTKPGYSDFLYNPTHFTGPLVCRIGQVPLYIHIENLLELLNNMRSGSWGNYSPVMRRFFFHMSTNWK